MRRCTSDADRPCRLKSVRSGEPAAGVSTWKSWKEAGARRVRTCAGRKHSAAGHSRANGRLLSVVKGVCMHSMIDHGHTAAESNMGTINMGPNVLLLADFSLLQTSSVPEAGTARCCVFHVYADACMQPPCTPQHPNRIAAATYPAWLLAACPSRCCCACAPYCRPLHLCPAPALPCWWCWCSTRFAELQLDGVQQQVVLPVVPLSLDVSKQTLGPQPVGDCRGYRAGQDSTGQNRREQDDRSVSVPGS